LDLALPEEEVDNRVQRSLPPLLRIKRLPLDVVPRHIEQVKEGREGGLERPIQGEELPHNLFAQVPRVVTVLDLEVGLEEIDQGQIGRGLPVRHRARSHSEPAVGAMRVRHLPHQA
jgi:hypothetical protein